MIFKLSDNWYCCLAYYPNYVLLDFDHSIWLVMHITQNWFSAGLDYHELVWFRYRLDHQLTSTLLQRVIQPVLPCVNLWDRTIPKGGLV